jgi:hypothetical protein
MEHKIVVIGNGKQTSSRVRQLLSKQSIEGPRKPNSTRDGFLLLLMSRHGYSSEKAEDELERHLRQFYRMRLNSGNHRD